MKKTAKRTVSLLLALVMVLGLAACGKTGGETGGQGDDEKVTLTIGLPLKNNVTDYENNSFTQWLEENTGYDLEFMFFSSSAAEAKSQITTMIVGGEKLPDIFYGIGLNGDESYQYGLDGYLLDLTDYFNDEELMADYRARTVELYGENYYGDMLRSIASPNGRIYGFPSAVVSESDLPMNMVYINQNWLDKLGLEKPRTWDELVTVLRAFRDGDPNGNGIADEIPMVGANATRCRIDNWLMNNFVRVNSSYHLNVDENGQAWLPYICDEYREGLKALHDLVDEGLLSAMTWSINDTKEVKSLWVPANGVAMVGVIGAHMSSHMTLDSPLMYDYEPLLPLEGSYAPRQTTNPSCTAFITGDTEYPDECFALLRAISTEDGSMAMRYGKEGVDWEWKNDYGKETVGVSPLNQEAYTGQTNSTWATAGAFMLKYSLSTKFRTPILHAPDELAWNEARFLKFYGYAEDYLKVTYATETDATINWGTTYSEEETEELGNIRSEVATYVKSSAALFATGDLDPHDDAQWNEYVKTVKSLGFDTWERLGNQAYQRYMAS